jgi:cytochrome c5
MSEEIHVEEHSSPIRTPKQLVIVVVLAFTVPIILIALIAHLATLSVDSAVDNPGMSEEAIAKRLRPVGEVAMMTEEERKARAAAAKVAPPLPPQPAASAQAAAPVQSAAGDAGKGKTVYDSACAACHAAGVAGAPKFGDKAAWAARIKSGMDTLYASALKGKGAMPSKGGNPGLGDAEVKAAVDYMVGPVK